MNLGAMEYLLQACKGTSLHAISRGEAASVLKNLGVYSVERIGNGRKLHLGKKLIPGKGFSLYVVTPMEA